MSNERRDQTIKFTKRVVTSINTKAGLNQAARELLEKIDASLSEYEKYTSLGLLDKSAVEKNVEQLALYKASLESGGMKALINNVTEDTCPVEPSPEDPERDAIILQRIEYKMANDRLREAQGAYNQNTEKLTKIKSQFAETPSPEGIAKSQYEHLKISFGPDVQKYTPPENYKEDAALRRGMEKLEAMQTKFIDKNRQITEVVGRISAKTSPLEQVKIYRGAIETLAFYKKSFKEIRKEIDTRVDALNSVESNYEKAVARYNALVSTAKELVEGPLLERVLQKYSELKDSSFDAVLKDLKELANLPLVGSKRPTSVEAMEKATEKYNQQADKVTFSQVSLHDKIEAIETKISELIKETDLEIEKQNAAFQRLAAEIHSHLMEALLPDSTEITLIEKKFQEAIQQSNVKDLEPLAFVQDRLLALQKISKELIAQIKIEKAKIKKVYEERIGIIDDDIQTRSASLLENIQKGTFRFSVGEQNALNKVKEYVGSSGGSVDGTIEGLKSVLQTATARKVEFDNALSVLGVVVETHETAKNLVASRAENKITDRELVKKINESPQGKELLVAMSKYPVKGVNEEALIEILNNHLTAFDKRGVAAVKDFITHSSVYSNEKRAIIKKLAFIEALEAKAIDYNDFLLEDDDTVRNVISAVLHLKAQNQTDFISEDNLRNKAFCDAVVLLKNQKIGLNEETLSALAGDPNKCAVIQQQIEQYQQHNEEFAQEYGDGHSINIPVSARPLDEAVFKAFLLDFLKAGPDVAKAAYAVIEGKKANNMDQRTARELPHWLIASIKEDATLRGILINDEHLDANIQFLGSVFDQSDACNGFLDDYTSEDPQKRLSSQTPFIIKSKPEKLILEQLKKANKNELGPVFDLKKMGIVMKQINEFIVKEQKKPMDKATLDSLKAFRNDAITELLSTKPPKEKQKALEGLADTYFKQTGFFERIMECIIEAFQSILPAKLVSSAQQSFFSTQKIGAVNQIRKGFEPSGPEPVSEMADEESELGMGENDPLIPKSSNP
ncbi:hypothetical protein [Legionella maioricensis]|uniref:Uncharacterized protein n=1 Tax=Legionella maioricensis TaxID=2896528 RepID=A0A9X2IBQ8_9GAMM|nr:hypothetical protein [Legionella maioricensis]MCL9684665.1 hypothetical protein [Legionella maioricensis]MCL9687445.1 hypothetical protein [Legionella maioricensis]